MRELLPDHDVNRRSGSEIPMISTRLIYGMWAIVLIMVAVLAGILALLGVLVIHVGRTVRSQLRKLSGT